MAEYSIVTTDAEFEALAGEWRELQSRAGTGIYTDYDHIHVWRRVLGHKFGRMLHIVIAREAGKLVGVLPLAVVKQKGFRVLQAVGEEAFYQADILLDDPAHALPLWQTAKESPHYDFADIRDIVPDSQSIPVLERFALLRDVDPELGLTLEWSDSESWKQSISGKMRYNSGRSLRQMNAIAPVVYELCQTGVPEALIEEMVQHKSLWCEANGMSGMFDQPNILAYFKELVKDAGLRNKLAFGWMKCGDELIFQHLMLTHNKTVYNYVVSTNAAWNKYSPGNLAYISAISWAIDHGYALFDHLQGDFSYKEKFSNLHRECREYCFARNAKGALGMQMFLKKRALRRYLRKQKNQPGAVGKCLKLVVLLKKKIRG